ncbi:hypothetical protein ABZ598_35525, partial [Streptomyces albus]
WVDTHFDPRDVLRGAGLLTPEREQRLVPPHQRLYDEQFATMYEELPSKEKAEVAQRDWRKWETLLRRREQVLDYAAGRGPAPVDDLLSLERVDAIAEWLDVYRDQAVRALRRLSPGHLRGLSLHLGPDYDLFRAWLAGRRFGDRALRWTMRAHVRSTAGKVVRRSLRRAPVPAILGTTADFMNVVAHFGQPQARAALDRTVEQVLEALPLHNDMLEEALHVLPPYPGAVFWGTSELPGSVDASVLDGPHSTPDGFVFPWARSTALRQFVAEGYVLPGGEKTHAEVVRAERSSDAGAETAPFSEHPTEEEVTLPPGTVMDKRASYVHTRSLPRGRQLQHRQTDAVQRAWHGRAVPSSVRQRTAASAVGATSGRHGQQVSVPSPRSTPAGGWPLPSDLIVQRIVTNGRPLVLASLPREKWAAMERTLQGLADAAYYRSWEAGQGRPYRVPGTRPLFWFSGGGPAGILLARQDGGTYVDDGRTVGSLIRAELQNLPPEERPWSIFVMSPGPGEDGAGLALLTVEHGHITGLTELPAAMSSGATAVTPSTDSLYPSELHLLPGADGRPTHWFTDDQAGGARLLPLRSGAPARNVTSTLPGPEHRFAVEDAPASARRLPVTLPAIPRGMSEVFRGWGEFRYGRSADGSWWAGVFPSGQWAARSPWLGRLSASVEFHSWTVGADGKPVGSAFRLLPGGARPLLLVAHGGPASEAVASVGVRFVEWLVAQGEQVTHLLAAPCGDGSGLVPGAYREWAVRHQGVVFAAPEDSAVGQGASSERAGWHNRPGGPAYLLTVDPYGRVAHFPERGVPGREASEVPLPADDLYNARPASGAAHVDEAFRRALTPPHRQLDGDPHSRYGTTAAEQPSPFRALYDPEPSAQSSPQAQSQPWSVSSWRAYDPEAVRFAAYYRGERAETYAAYSGEYEHAVAEVLAGPAVGAAKDALRRTAERTGRADEFGDLLALPSDAGSLDPLMRAFAQLVGADVPAGATVGGPGSVSGRGFRVVGGANGPASRLFAAYRESGASAEEVAAVRDAVAAWLVG